MKIFAYAESGFAGRLIAVEVDIRRGIPSLDIVGLPDSAIRESRDRVRVAIRRSGYEFPMERILVNLSPAGLRKEGAAYDLPVAVGILIASGQVDSMRVDHLLCIGELQLDGTVRAVPGVLPAAATALQEGVAHLLVPKGNTAEAAALGRCRILPVAHLKELPGVLERPVSTEKAPLSDGAAESFDPIQDLAEIRGQGAIRRALECAAAGGHHLLLFGPPGSGKTMAARALPGLLPEMDFESSLDVTRIWSQAGKIRDGGGLIRRPPFREPHHSSSAEGLVGGGSGTVPGESSLAHQGVLFLDEAPEFGVRVLQSLREPLESGQVHLARAGRTWWYPADFQLLLAMNPCPCGNLGREDAVCLCTPPELYRHWRKLGGALMDRIDIRLPVEPVKPEVLLDDMGESSQQVRDRVSQARERQRSRYADCEWSLNARIPPGAIARWIPLKPELRTAFTDSIRKTGLSSRGAHGVLKVARTIADLDDRDSLVRDDLLEALHYRRFGDRDLYWKKI